MKQILRFLFVFIIASRALPVFADSHSASDEGPVYIINHEGDSDDAGEGDGAEAIGPRLMPHSITETSVPITSVTKKTVTFGVRVSPEYPMVPKTNPSVAPVTPATLSHRLALTVHNGNFDVYENYSLPVTTGLDWSYRVRYLNKSLDFQPYFDLRVGHGIGRYLAGVDLEWFHFGGGIQKNHNGVMGVAEAGLITSLTKILSRNELTVTLIRADLIRINETFLVIAGNLSAGIVCKELVFFRPQVAKRSFVSETGLTMRYIPPMFAQDTFNLFLGIEGMINSSYENVYSGEVGVNF